MTIQQWRNRNGDQSEPRGLVSWVMDYKGALIGLNDYNSSWRKLKALKEKVSMDFAVHLLKNRPPRFKYFELYISHNTRYDMDNVAGMVKPCVDTLRKQSVIDDDNRKYWDKLVIIYDPSLPKNVVRFEMKGEVKTRKA